MTQIRYTAVAVFDNRTSADEAIKDLYQQGFRQDQIGLLTRRNEGAKEKEDDGSPSKIKAVEGAGIGLLVGASLGGALAGDLLTGVVEGGVAGGVIGALIGVGMPEEEARYYQSELEAGHTIVAVNADGRYDEAFDILRRHGGRVCESPLSHVGPGVLP